jgi:spore maturation protein CgeB
LKITIFGLTISSSWGNGHATPYRAIIRALDRMGHEVHFFEKDVPYYRSRRDFEDCSYCKLTLYENWSEIRRSALETARASDIVVTASYLPEGQQINDEVLSLEGPLRIFYDLDTPITIRNLDGAGVEYLRADQIPGFDLFLSFSGGEILRELERRGARMARPLCGCVDPDDYQRTASDPQFACDLSYMGTFAPDRQPKVDELFLEPARRHAEKQFVLAGPMYPWEWQWPLNVRRIEHIGPEMHPCFYSSCRLTLNITRAEMVRWGYCPSGRFFEAAACGTPLITDFWQGLESFFEPDRDLLVVNCPDDVERALALPDAALQAMAHTARQRTLDQHTGRVRAQQLLKFLEEAGSAASASASSSLAREVA